MTTINLFRAVLEQALEAMRCAVPTGKITLADWHKSIAGLEAVLAQQAEPVKPVAWANIDSDRLRVDPATGNVSIGAQQAEPPGSMPQHERLKQMEAQRQAEPVQKQAEPLTIERLRDALVASRIIPPAAVEDPDGYDDGVTLFRIEALHRRIT